jgi:hypothetical protein
MSSDPYIWFLTGMSENEWKEIYHCYEECCHVSTVKSLGARVPCGPHCEVDLDWSFFHG